MTDDKLRKLEKLKLLEAKVYLQQGLPHLYGFKFYPWAREFFETKKREAFLCAGNQVSKSSTQWRRVIHLATAMDEWPDYWTTRPRQFWYCYPTRDVSHIEWKKKIEVEFMPRGDFKNHPVFGWKAEFYHARIFAIHFNSGVSVYFKTYAQDAQDLQTGTCHYVALDEEPPEAIMGELGMRLTATDGYLSAVFTPTIGQEYWREVIEVEGRRERFPNAFKKQISMYDCLYYEDGSRSAWTIEKINRAKNSCKSEAEVQRRVFGRFVIDEDLKYPSYNRDKNWLPSHPLPKDWWIYCGVDPGSGGDNHPAAIVFVAVSPDMTKGRVFRGWRGDGVITTISDIVEKLIDMMKGMPQPPFIHYDWSSRDFFNIATQMGLTVHPAEKSHEIGEQILNVLFKNEMLGIYDIAELEPLSVELCTLKNVTPKNKAKDDFIDSLRYAVTKIPWNWESIRADFLSRQPKVEQLTAMQQEIKDRREGTVSGLSEAKAGTFEREFDEWNDLMEGYGDD